MGRWTSTTMGLHHGASTMGRRSLQHGQVCVAVLGQALTTFLQTTSNPNEATRRLNLRLPAMDLLVVALVILCCALGVLASCLAWLVASTTRRSSTPPTTICYHRTTQTEMSYTITKHYREPRLKALGHGSHGGWIDGIIK